MKTCIKCSISQPLVNFYNEPKVVNGVKTICKTCYRADCKRWREANRARHKEMIANWNEKNSDRKQAANKAWKKANPDKVKESDSRRAYREKNAPGGPFRLDRLDYDSRYRFYGGRCAYCGAHPDTMDHLKALAKGGSNWASNVVPSCKRCNMKKSTKTAWKDWPKPNIPGPLTRLP